MIHSYVNVMPSYDLIVSAHVLCRAFSLGPQPSLMTSWCCLLLNVILSFLNVLVFKMLALHSL